MATKQTINNISFRKSNRNYSESISWTEEMNEVVYNFYVEARRNPSRGYMKRLKTLWDAKHPNYSHFTENHLRQKATHVERKKEENNQEVGVQEEVIVESIDLGENIINEAETQNVNNADNSTHDTNKALYDELEQKFLDFYNKFVEIPINKRIYSTRINNIPPSDVMVEINNVITTFIEQIPELTFWNINVIHYAAAITICDKVGNLKENVKRSSKDKRDAWKTQALEQLSAIRRKISYIEVTLKCLKCKTFTKRQKEVSRIVSKICGTLKESSLNSKLVDLKHDLKVHQMKFDDRVSKAECSRINDMFRNNQKIVYREFKGGQVKVNESPPVEEIHSFWNDIWGKTKEINTDNPCYKDLLRKMANNKAPGRDCIIAYWIKNLESLHVPLIKKTFY